MRGYFWHLHTDFVPSKYDFAYFKISEGKTYNAAFKEAWDKAGAIQKGIYQRPIISASVSIADNVSFMVQHVSNYAGGQSALATMPIIFNAEYNMNLVEIQSYINYLWTELLRPNYPKPMMYISAKRWLEIQKGNDAGNISYNISKIVDVCLTDWILPIPAKISPVVLIKGWEYDKGLLQYDPNGVFTAVIREIVPPADSVVTVNSITLRAQLRLDCLKLAVEIAMRNTSGILATEPIEVLADKLFVYVNK